jgi:glutaconate CoA-transferase subunit A
MPEYGVDMGHLKTYTGSAKDGGWDKYFQDFVACSQEEYLQKIGGMDALKALPKKSY